MIVNYYSYSFLILGDDKMKSKILFTGGGSAGHVTPNIAIISKVKKDFDVIYVGSKDGIEKKLINDIGTKYFEISTGKLRRYFSIKNFTDPFKVILGFSEASSIMKREKPNIVFSKGGFVSVPVVIAAYFNNIPVVLHESDITPGLANKICIPFCKKVCVTFEECLNKIGSKKAVLTGPPIRDELLNGSRLLGEEFCKFKVRKPVLLLMGGSSGSLKLNKILRESLPEILIKFNVVHLCGKNNLDNQIVKLDGYKQYEYLTGELANVMTMADVIVSRAGSNSIFEILALRKPNLLIPLSKSASRGDQILNAKSFEKKGYSSVLMEEDLSNDKFISSVSELYNNRNFYIKNMNNTYADDGVKKVINVIDAVLDEKFKKVTV